jgi:hypothetical protein
MVRIPDSGKRRESGAFFVAAEDAGQLASDLGPLLERTNGIGWYDEIASDVDLAAFMLCRLRRARAGVGGSMEHGDDAVRTVLAQASPEAVVWIASRAVSYMDETGFPESVESWFPDVLTQHPESEDPSAR